MTARRALALSLTLAAPLALASPPSRPRRREGPTALGFDLRPIQRDAILARTGNGARVRLGKTLRVMTFRSAFAATGCPGAARTASRRTCARRRRPR